MRKLISVAFILLSTSFISHSQSFTWGYPFGISDETEKAITHVVEDKLYKISTHYDLNIFNHKIIADAFSLNGLEKEQSLDLSVEQPPMGLASLTFNSLFQKEGTDFIFFYTEYDRKTKRNNLFYRNVNIGNGEMGDLSLLTAIDANGVSNSGEYIISQSADKSRFSILKQLPFEKKANEKIELLLVDENLNILKQKNHDFGVVDNRRKQHSVYVSNTGEVYLVKKIEEKKEKPYLNLYHWDSKNDDITATSLKQEDDYQLHQFKVAFNDSDFYFLGVLTHEKSSNFGLKIDFNGRHSGVSGSGLLAVRFSGDVKMVYNTRNDFPQIISNLNLNNILFEEEHVWIVYDRSYVEKKSNTSNLGQGDISYDYTYLNNGFFVNQINATTGDLSWVMKIDTNEPNTKNDNGDYLSTLSYIENSNLVLLYNETRDINKGIVHNVLNRRFPIKETISSSGEIVSREALLSAGIGVSKEERFELNPSLMIPVSSGTFIIRARSHAEYKYGYLKI